MRGRRHDEQADAGDGPGRGPAGSARAGDGVRHGSARRGAPDGRGGRMRGRAGPRPHRGSPELAGRAGRRARRARRPGVRGRRAAAACRASSWRSRASRRPRPGSTRWRWGPNTCSPCRRPNPGWSRRSRRPRRAEAATARCSPSSAAGAAPVRPCSRSRRPYGRRAAATRALLVDCDPLGGGAGPRARRRGPGRPALARRSARARAGCRRAPCTRRCPHRSWTARAGWPCSRATGPRTGPPRPRWRRSSTPAAGRARRWSATCPATPPKPRSRRSAPPTSPSWSCRRTCGRAPRRREWPPWWPSTAAVRRAGRPRPRTGRHRPGRGRYGARGCRWSRRCVRNGGSRARSKRGNAPGRARGPLATAATSVLDALRTAAAGRAS